MAVFSGQSPSVLVQEAGDAIVNNSMSAAGPAKRLLIAFLVAVASDLALIVLRVLLYTPLLRQHNALIFILEPVILLILYVGIAVATTRNTGSHRYVALRDGATVGLVTGVMWIVYLAIETFSPVSGIPVTAPFLLGAFVLWGVAGFLAARQTGSLALGILAAIWAAMLCVLLAITFGFLLTYTSLPTLERQMVTDPDFLRSRWSDIRAFAIANAFDSAFSHLLGALIVSAIFGAVGSATAVLTRR